MITVNKNSMTLTEVMLFLFYAITNVLKHRLG